MEFLAVLMPRSVLWSVLCGGKSEKAVETVEKGGLKLSSCARKQQRAHNLLGGWEWNQDVVMELFLGCVCARGRKARAAWAPQHGELLKGLLC
jgi:hypothetical protein